MDVKLENQTASSAEKHQKGKILSSQLSRYVSFSLAGHLYGFHIRYVKEIRKSATFTYVPNTRSFLRGVDNLRGEILPIIDLRILLQLPFSRKTAQEEENLLVLLLPNELHLGLIVDTIEKVLSLAPQDLSPPHPVMGGLAYNYTEAISSIDDRTLHILDPEILFSQDFDLSSFSLRREDKSIAYSEESPIIEELLTEETVHQASIQEESFEKTESSSSDAQVQKVSTDSGMLDEESHQLDSKQDSSLDVAKQSSSISQDLLLDLSKRLLSYDYHVTEINQKALLDLIEYVPQSELMKKSSQELVGKLSSHCSRSFWTEDMLQHFIKLLQNEGLGLEIEPFHLWNVGFVEGFETYSMAVALEHFGKKTDYKIWAFESNLMWALSALGRLFPLPLMGSAYDSYMQRTSDANQAIFPPEWNQKIFFEFSNALHSFYHEEFVCVVARDILSTHQEGVQHFLVEIFAKSLMPGGLFIVGDHEDLGVFNNTNFEHINDPLFRVYRKKQQ